jgi:hypothetical protein
LVARTILQFPKCRLINFKLNYLEVLARHHLMYRRR